MKSSPSAAALVIRITFTISPFLFFGFVTIFISAKLSGENVGSPVIIIYFACLNNLSSGSFGFNVSVPIAGTGGVLNNDFVCAAAPVRANPSSSKHRAKGTTPPSTYCEKTITIPVLDIIELQIEDILLLYFGISSLLKMRPYFDKISGLYSNSCLRKCGD